MFSLFVDYDVVFDMVMVFDVRPTLIIAVEAVILARAANIILSIKDDPRRSSRSF